MDYKRYKKKGFLDNYIMSAVSIFIVIVFFSLIIEYLEPLSKYIRLNQVVRKYALQMERDGGLAPTGSVSYTSLKSELRDLGCNLYDDNSTNYDTKVILSPVSNTAKFGDEVSIEIQYKYKKRLVNLEGNTSGKWLKVNRKDYEKLMPIKKSTISKKAR